MTIQDDITPGILSTDLYTEVGDQHIDLTSLIHLLYIDIENQISRADNKSQLVLSTNAILAAVIASFGLHLELNGETPALATVILVTYALMFLALMLSVYFALAASIPRLTKPAGSLPPVLNLFFTTHIAHHPRDEYVAAFLGMTIQEVKITVLQQIHAKSVVVQRKYANVRRSILLLMLAIAMLAVAQAFQLTL